MNGLEYGQVVISAITTAELRFGVEASARFETNRLKLERFLANFEIAAFHDAASRHYGELRARLMARGTPIGPLGTLIAGHALALKAAVVTHNVGEFSRVVPGLPAVRGSGDEA
jgi:tRNA(fMet)-specific endonuclease VapC